MKDDGKLLGGFVLTFVVSALLILLALTGLHAELGNPSVARFDRDLQWAVHRATSTWLTYLMFAFTWIGSPKILFPLVPAIAALLWWRRLRHEPVFLVVAMFGASLLDTNLKLHFHRPRPVLPWAMVHERSFSFPSGHSLYAAVLYCALAYLALRRPRVIWEKAAIAFASVAMVVAIGLSRIYLGAHFPTDVAAGYAAGLIWITSLILFDLFLRRSGVNLASR